MYRQVLLQLKNEIERVKPLNVIQFIKRWAIQKSIEQQLKQNRADQFDSNSDTEQQQQKQLKNIHKQRQKSKQSYKKGAKHEKVKLIKRRNAICLAHQLSFERHKQKNRAEIVKNEQCKSRVMLRLLHSILLPNLQWQQVSQLIQSSKMYSYTTNETILDIGEQLNRMFFVVSGEVMHNKLVYYQGDAFCEEMLIGSGICSAKYIAKTDNTQVCQLQTYRIREYLLNNQKNFENFVESILVKMPIFSILDNQEITKLIKMVKVMDNLIDNDVIIRLKQKTQNLFIIMKGQVIKYSEGLIKEQMSILKKGDYFGEEILHEKNVEGYIMKAKGQCTLAYINKKDIERGIEQISKLWIRYHMIKK